VNEAVSPLSRAFFILFFFFFFFIFFFPPLYFFSVFAEMSLPLFPLFLFYFDHTTEFYLFLITVFFLPILIFPSYCFCCVIHTSPPAPGSRFLLTPLFIMLHQLFAFFTHTRPIRPAEVYRPRFISLSPFPSPPPPPPPPQTDPLRCTEDSL